MKNHRAGSPRHHVARGNHAIAGVDRITIDSVDQGQLRKRAFLALADLVRLAARARQEKNEKHQKALDAAERQEQQQRILQLQRQLQAMEQETAQQVGLVTEIDL